MANFVGNYDNSDKVKLILQGTQNEMVLFVLSELLSKNFFGKKQIGVVFKCKLHLRTDCYEFDKSAKTQETFIQEEMISTCLDVLFQKGQNLQDFVVRSLGNVIGVGIKHLWFLIEDKKAISNEIHSKFFSDPRNMHNIKNGLLLNNLIVQNLLINNASFGYFKYRNMIGKFLDDILFDMFSATKKIIIGISEMIMSGQANQDFITLLGLCFQNFHQVMTFPFCLSYSEFTSEVNLEETTTTFLPDNWEPLIIDLDLFEKMVHLTTIAGVPMQVRLSIMKVFSRLSSVKPSVIKEDIKQVEYIKFFLLLPNRILPHLNIQDKGCLEDLLDLFLRLTYVMSLRRIVQYKEEFDVWMNCFLVILSQVFQNYYQVDDKLFQTVNQLFKKITYHYSGVEYDFAGKLLQSFKLYMNVNFSPTSGINIFKELSYSHFEKFKKLVDTRFEYFKEFYTSDKQNVYGLIDGALSQSMEELTVISIY